MKNRVYRKDLIAGRFLDESDKGTLNTVVSKSIADEFHKTVGDTLNVVYLGLFPTMLGFTTWAYALARTPSGKMGATTYAVPGLVVLMSWLILGQVPRWLTIAGGALCLAGVAVSRGRKRSPAPLEVPDSVGSAAG